MGWFGEMCGHLIWKKHVKQYTFLGGEGEGGVGRQNLMTYNVKMDICIYSICFQSPYVYLAGLGLNGISRSLQDRRLNRLARGKYGRAGDHAVHDHRQDCDNTLVRSFGITVATDVLKSM